MTRQSRLLIGVLGFTAICALGAVQATISAASFHLVQIREVFPGTAASPNAEYVELQMWAPGQNFVAGHSVRTFGPTGAPIATNTIAASVPNGANQSTLVLATPEARTMFGIAADAQIAPGGQLDPKGGAVCWEEGLDCVSWGSFTGTLPSAAGTPALPAGIPDGSALQRTIAPSCPTLLESGDDRNDSAMDFAAAPPAPRPNSVAPTEIDCRAAETSGPPRTALRGKPAKRTRDRTPTFRFASDQAGSTFQCKVDRKPFRSCRSPYTTKPLRPGRHTFKVRARSASGVDSSPAAYPFTVLGKR